MTEELTLSEKVYIWEQEMSGEDGAKEFKDGIDNLSTAIDVVEYYLDDRDWDGNVDFMRDLAVLLADLIDDKVFQRARIPKKKFAS